MGVRGRARSEEKREKECERTEGGKEGWRRAREEKNRGRKRKGEEEKGEGGRQEKRWKMKKEEEEEGKEKKGTKERTNKKMALGTKKGERKKCRKVG